jgi:succinoglycan biosynthesis protein ExoO
MPIAASASTTERPRVSVLLPAYNAAGTLKAALRSVLEQTLAEIEVIVVDDGSRDGTLAMAKAAALADPRIRVLQSAKNGGAAAARNLALATARGDWLALLDADDSLMPGRLACLVSLGEAEGADIVADNLRLMTADGLDRGEVLTQEDPIFTGPLSASTFCRRNLFLTPGFKLGYLKPIFRRRFLAHHDLRQDEGLRIGEDFHFLLEALLAGGRCILTPRAGYRYRLMPGSLSRNLTLADLQKLSASNKAILARPTVPEGSELHRAVKQRQWSIDLNVDFVRFVTALKEWEVLNAGTIFARHPDLMPFLVFYGLQSLRKRLPGARDLV